MSSKLLLKNKIKNLCLDKKTESKITNYIDKLDSLQADNQIYFKLGNYQINNDNGHDTKVFLTYWGGETIHNCLDCLELNEIEKNLLDISYPKLICVRVAPNQIENLYDIIQEIVISFPYSLYKFSKTIILDNNNIDIIKILDFNLNDKVGY